MDRELLIEIGCEEMPASWLPDLTARLGRNLDARLSALRIPGEAPAEAYSTPRRLAARVARLPERQTDLEDVVTGPPERAIRNPDGTWSQAALGFAKKQGVDVEALERVETPKGVYLSHRVHQRGKATVDVLPEVLGGLLREMTFPKQMRWDAYLEDGKGDLPFGRPIRWLVLLFGGRVVPFVIRRTELAQGRLVQDIRTSANTYGHRFLATSGRAGRAVKVKTFDDYQARLLENFVILDRAERESRIRRGLEMHARKLGGRVGTHVAAQSALLREVPDLVEYPSVVAGHFNPEFLSLPEEVLVTTMIHHQHYFPVVDDEGRLKPAFMAVTNMEVERPELIARNAERVLTARLRDARFFFDEDRKTPLESRIGRLETILFHKQYGSYRQKADQIAALAGRIAREVLARPDAAEDAERAARLAKADLATDMVRELTELQGTMGGIYAREEGLPEAVWKAIYYHYLPTGVDAAAAPSREQLGAAAVVWAAVSLADKLHSTAVMFWAGEKPRGTRDPLGVRRLGNGVVRLLADLPALTGLTAAPSIGELLDAAADSFQPLEKWDEANVTAMHAFMLERCEYLLEQRGFDPRSVRAVLHRDIHRVRPLEALRKLEALAQMSRSEALLGVAALLKRVKNITKGVVAPDAAQAAALRGALVEPAELALADAIDARAPDIAAAAARGDSREAFTGIAALQPSVATFFDDVLVMAEDAGLRTARLALVARLRDLILDIADISEIVAESP
jgi:glycyl-tRNA synthetase beta chain